MFYQGIFRNALVVMDSCNGFPVCYPAIRNCSGCFPANQNTEGFMLEEIRKYIHFI